MASTTPESSSADGAKEAAILMHETPVVAVLGTGMYGRALAYRLRMNNQIEVRVGSRNPSDGQVTQVEAVQGASAVFLAVPASAHASVIRGIGPHLSPGVVVVDISNHALCAPPPTNTTTSIAHKLRQIVPDGVVVAKAFNTLSSYALTTSKRPSIVQIACDSSAGVDVLSAICIRAGLVPVHHGKLAAAVELEAKPHRLFPTWRSSVYVSLVVFGWWILYNTLAGFVIYGPGGIPSRPWRKWPLEVFVSATAETSMTLFALTFIPGPVAGIIHLYRGSASKPFGRFFGGWLDMRKELGVVAFFFASMHACGGAITKAHLKADSGWKEHAYFTLGIISYAAFAILAVSTSQSVADSMSWKEFRAVFSWIGMAGLVFGVLHQGFWGWILHKHRPTPKSWSGNGAVMPSYWLGIIIPLVAIALRLVTWSPCAVSPLRKLRNEVRVELKQEQLETV